MTRSDVRATNKKSIKCPDCGKWVTLQGYGGHQRFYHGMYQKQLKSRLFKQLLDLSRAGKIDKGTFNALIHMTGEGSDTTMQELIELQDTIDILRKR